MLETNVVFKAKFLKRFELEARLHTSDCPELS